MAIEIQENVLLSNYTTIGLGGKAKLFVSCVSADEINAALNFSKEKKLKVQVISGGSNIIFPDEEFKGLVLKVDLKGIEITEDNDFIFARVCAGENWDGFVETIIEKGLSGIECLSGIPGSVGATPIQNVGAYGQEVKDTMVSLNAIDRHTLETVTFDNPECEFEYRQSRFKTNDKDKYIITEVSFRFEKNKKPEIKYPELQNYIESHFDKSPNDNLPEKLNQIRKSVLELRKKKSMLIDKDDPNSKSCGSFFMNPVLNEIEFEKFSSRATAYDFPFYQTGKNYKIPAAWLVEQTCFSKGYKKDGVGISENHSLALINLTGTSMDLLRLANEIEEKVLEKFGVKLDKEPVIV
ncbi:MAG: UDP-N-acetylmuramate dehydrogenase [Bacteroidota bacterium]|nr:UDP-N-acetylmuramate dehydrogenase [Bacteroidota bacterium]